MKYLQSLLDANKSASTIMGYVAAILVHHSKVGNQTVGSYTPASLKVPNGRIHLKPLWCLCGTYP